MDDPMMRNNTVDNGTKVVITALTNLTSVSAMSRHNPFIVDPDDLKLAIICYCLLASFFSFFFLIVGIDMKRKCHTGELQETGRNFVGLFLTIVKAPGKLFTRRNTSICWYWLTNLFRKTENKKLPGKRHEKVSLGRHSDSTNTIERLGGGESPNVTEVPNTNVAVDLGTYFVFQNAPT